MDNNIFLVFVDSNGSDNRCAILKLKTDKDRMAFRMECLEFLSATTAKIVERSPLRYKIVQAVACLVPSTVCSNSVLAESRLNELVQILYNENQITAVTADKSKMQMSGLRKLASEELHQEFKDF